MNVVTTCRSFGKETQLRPVLKISHLPGVKLEAARDGVKQKTYEEWNPTASMIPDDFVPKVILVI